MESFVSYGWIHIPRLHIPTKHRWRIQTILFFPFLRANKDVLVMWCITLFVVLTQRDTSHLDHTRDERCYYRRFQFQSFHKRVNLVSAQLGCMLMAAFIFNSRSSCNLSDTNSQITQRVSQTWVIPSAWGSTDSMTLFFLNWHVANVHTKWINKDFSFLWPKDVIATLQIVFHIFGNSCISNQCSKQIFNYL